MEVDFLAPTSPFEVHTAEERPDLWEEARPLFHGVWPEYNFHGATSSLIFDSLMPTYAHLQVLLYDRDLGRIVGRGRTIPFCWDGTLDDLPRGIDAAGLRALGDARPANALSALSAEVAVSEQGRGLSRHILEAMAACARGVGLARLVAPVRPNHKDRHPTIPIERYSAWKTNEGLPFDPWMRVHARLGATILRTEPESLGIEAPVAEWASWTAMEFPEDGDYVFRGGLALLRVRDGTGSYWEPNVWMQHPL
jgi:GNAT superfamily N-acetyltransferase